MIACEPETGAPLTASFAAGEPSPVDYRASFVDGAGSKALLPGDVGARRGRCSPAPSPFRSRRPPPPCACSQPRAHVVAEGAGALALAAALAGHGGEGRVVCIVSGGNIDPATLAAILQGETPGE